MLTFIVGQDEVATIAAILDENLDYLVPADMQITDLDSRTEMGSKIREIYTGGEPFGDHLGDTVRVYYFNRY